MVSNLWMMNSYRTLLVVVALGSTSLFLGSCAHREEVLLDQQPEYVPPDVPIATQPESAVAQLNEDQRRDAADATASWFLRGLVEAAWNSAFGSDDERREKRWKRSRQRKILVKKGYIDKDAGPPLKGSPSQFGL